MTAALTEHTDALTVQTTALAVRTAALTVRTIALTNPSVVSPCRATGVINGAPTSGVLQITTL